MCNQQRLRPACTYVQSDQSLCLSLEYSMTVKLLIEQHLEFLSFTGSCTGSSESMSICHMLEITCRCSNVFRILSIYHLNKGAQWLSGRVLNSRPRGHEFEPQRRRCLLMVRKESSQTNKQKPSQQAFVKQQCTMHIFIAF